jgi:DNA repair exonuclease SbcCD ATPase subunit
MDDDVLFLVSYLFTHPSVVKEAMLRLRDSYTPEIDQLETRLQSVEGRIQELRDEADEVLATKRQAKTAQAQAFLAKRLDELFEEIEGLEAERKVQATIAQKWEDIGIRRGSYERWAEQMALIIQDATYQWKRAALVFLGLTVTVSNRKSSPRYRINCTLGGVQSYFAADSDQIAQLREGRLSIYDMYRSSYERSQ